MADSISVTIEERRIEVTVLAANFIQVNLLEPVVLDSVAENTDHRLGDGADHANVVANTTKLAGIEAGAEVNNISDIDAVALTGGGETGLHTHTTAGGGLWTTVETRVMHGSPFYEFVVGTNDTVIFVFENLKFDVKDFLKVFCSIDGGGSYPSTHKYAGPFTKTSSTSVLGINATGSSGFVIINDQVLEFVNGGCSLYSVAQTGFTTIKSDVASVDNIGANWRHQVHGTFETSGVVDKIKVGTILGNDIVTGKIHLLKRLF